MRKIVISKNSATGIVFIFAIILCSALNVKVIFGETKTIEDGGQSVGCSGTSPFRNLETSFEKCQTSTTYSDEAYRYSRWVYYNVENVNVLPEKNGKKYVPAIGPSVLKDGVKSDQVQGWAEVGDDMSDCIVENGGFWRRGFFIYKNVNGAISWNGLKLGAEQDGMAPVGFSGRSSNNWGIGTKGSGGDYGHNYTDSAQTDDYDFRTWTGKFDDGWKYDSTTGKFAVTIDESVKWANSRVGANDNDFIGEFSKYSTTTDEAKEAAKHWTLTGDVSTDELGMQSLWIGDRTKVWASMDNTVTPIDDERAQQLLEEFNDSSNPSKLVYGRYFLYDEPATVAFCYSDRVPYDGVVEIGSANNKKAYDKKNYGSSEEKNVSAGQTKVSDNPITIDLGSVSSRSYTPSHLRVNLSKTADRTGKTKYRANLYLNGVKTHSYTTSGWSTTTSDGLIETDSNITSSSSPSFNLNIGENTICVDLDYQERLNGDSVSLKACAKITYDPSFTCNLNGATISYSNPVNYGRMRIYKNSDAGTILGDSVGGTYTPSATMWLKPEDKVSITYDGCIGEQIAKDAGVADWNTERTGNNQNSIMRVETTGSLLNGSHYTGTGNSIDKDSANSRNITAYEVLGSKISEHINAKYQFGEQKTKQAQVGNVGRTINNEYKIRSDDSRNVRATMKIPYNYILEPKAVNTTGGIVTLGGSATFNVQIIKNGRINESVDKNNDYSTDVKASTRAKYLSFRLSTGTDLSEFTDKLRNIEYLDGNNVDNLSGILKANFSTSDIESGDISVDDINSNSGKDIKLKAADASADYNKLCVAVAVWPADSHNIRTTKIESEDQPTALDPDHYYDGAFTRISASCKTIGKYPSMSVEGNGIVSAGDVKGATTKYSATESGDKHIFGSWSEYGLVANGVVSLGSGASLAYDINHPQTQKNQMSNYEYAGLIEGRFDSPQTLGNIDDSIGLQDSVAASIYIDQMKSFVENIKSTYFAEKQTCGSFLCQIGNTYVNTNYDAKVTIGATEAAEINSHKNEDAQVFIYSQQDIVIKNEVTELYANLITDGKLDTCAEGDHKTDATSGKLVDNCYNVLVVNGAVYSEGEISLDRVFGGGSPYGSMSLDSSTLVQRAEIFNFDPKIVKWGYDYKHEVQPITTTYIEELSTRY